MTVLWEDERGANAKGFGPHSLLLACLGDDLQTESTTLKRMVESHPKNGNGNVRNALRRDAVRLRNSGPVVVIVDRDQITDLWKGDVPTSACMTNLSARFHADAPGDYELVFLIENVETLIDVTCDALRKVRPTRKPRPDERDRYLNEAAWSNDGVRKQIRQACPSFDRIVNHIANHHLVRQSLNS